MFNGVTDNTVESVEDFLPKTLEELEKVQVNQKLPGLEEALPQIEEKLNPEKIEGICFVKKLFSLVQDNFKKQLKLFTSLSIQIIQIKKLPKGSKSWRKC